MAYFVREVGLEKSDFWLPEKVTDIHDFKTEKEAKGYLSEKGYKEKNSSKGIIYARVEEDDETYTTYRAIVIKAANIYNVIKVHLLDKWLLSTIR